MNYGLEKNIRRDRVNPKTSLAVRLNPRQKKVDDTTRVFRTYRIPIIALKVRSNNQKDCLLDEPNVETLSYLPMDLPYAWKDPFYWESSLKRKGAFKDSDTEYKTIDEAFETGENENEVHIFSCFNLIQKTQFYDFELKKWKIRNSEELEEAIECPCMLVDIDGVMFDKDELWNIEEKRKTVKGTEAGLVPFTNIANPGPTFDEKDKTRKIVKGKHQNLPFNCLLEWFVPYFDNEIQEIKDDGEITQHCHGLFKLDGDKLKTNDAWKTAYLKSQPKQYESDKRFNLMYRIYDPARETTLMKEYAEKLVFVDKATTEFFKRGAISEIFDLLRTPNLETAVQKTTRLRNMENYKNAFLLSYTIETDPQKRKYLNLREYKNILEDIFKEMLLFYFKDKQETLQERAEKLKRETITNPNLVFKVRLRNVIKNIKGNVDLVKEIAELTNSDIEYYTDGEHYLIRGFAQDPFIHKAITKIMTTKLLGEYNTKLHHMRRKIFARVMKTAKPNETSWMFLYFKEPAKGPI